MRCLDVSIAENTAFSHISVIWQLVGSAAELEAKTKRD